LKIYGYGEDALTHWALTHRINQILDALSDSSIPDDLTLFFRPSFGRRGGEKSSQFGEFDFILLTNERVLLGESKFDRSPEASSGEILNIRPEQILRHEIFQQYVNEWTCGTYASWDDFLHAIEDSWPRLKPPAPSGSLLSENLELVLGTIQRKYQSTPVIENVILYLFDGRDGIAPDLEAPEDFRLVAIDYGSSAYGNYIEM
jgi:hypothetical protein